VSEDDPLLAFSQLFPSELEGPTQDNEIERDWQFLQAVKRQQGVTKKGMTVETKETNHGGFLMSYEYAGKINEGDTTATDPPKLTRDELEAAYEGLRVERSGSRLAPEIERTLLTTDTIKQRRVSHYISEEGKVTSEAWSPWVSIDINHRLPKYATDGSCAYFCAGTAVDDDRPYRQVPTGSTLLCRPCDTMESHERFQSEAVRRYPPGAAREIRRTLRNRRISESWDALFEEQRVNNAAEREKHSQPPTPL
jgi:hypothetical protein